MKNKKEETKNIEEKNDKKLVNEEDNSKVSETEKNSDITDEKLEKIKDEIKINKKKSKKSTKNAKVLREIGKNILIGIVISIYFLFVSLGVKTIPITEYMMDLKTFAMFIVIIAIVIFERAYKKDDNALALHGIEMVCLGIETLVILNLYSLKNEYFEYVLYWITGGMFAYYMIKCAVILIKSKIKK